MVFINAAPSPSLVVQMQNRMAVLMCNLKPAKMRGVVSQAMVMCASSPDKVEILDPPAGSVPGDRLTFQGFPGTPVHPSDRPTGPTRAVITRLLGFSVSLSIFIPIVVRDVMLIHMYVGERGLCL